MELQKSKNILTLVAISLLILILGSGLIYILLYEIGQRLDADSTKNIGSSVPTQSVITPTNHIQLTTPTGAETQSDKILFNENISFSRDSKVISMNFKSFINKNADIKHNTGFERPEGSVGQYIIIDTEYSKLTLEVNPYDAGGYWTATDYDYKLVDNKLDKYLLRAEISPAEYVYSEFAKGKCVFDVQKTITPFPPNLECGVPWLYFSNPKDNSAEIVLLSCNAKKEIGIKQCDEFIENLEVEVL